VGVKIKSKRMAGGNVLQEQGGQVFFSGKKQNIRVKYFFSTELVGLVWGGGGGSDNLFDYSGSL
jgi:hypothetical protein